MARHAVSTVFTTTATGSASSPGISGLDIASYNDFEDRRVVGLFVSGSTAGIAARLVNAGQNVAQIDTTAFSAAAGPFPLDVTFVVGQQFHIDFANYTGGNLTTASITIVYESAH